MPIRCGFCDSKAGYVAPQYIGGDPCEGVKWVSVCWGHLERWWDDIPKESRIACFRLTDGQHEAFDNEENHHA